MDGKVNAIIVSFFFITGSLYGQHVSAYTEIEKPFLFSEGKLREMNYLNSEYQNADSLRAENNINSLMSEDSISTALNTPFNKIEIYAGAGLPYLVNIGGKYRFSQTFFLELETAAITGLLKEGGYFYLSGGVTTTKYAKSSSFIYFDGEIAILVGNFPEAWFFSGPKSGAGGGLTLRGNLGTNLGFALSAKLGGAVLFNGYGIAIYQVGLGLHI